MKRSHLPSLIKITLLALIISAIPLPKIVSAAAPFWLLLFYIYWLSYVAEENNAFIALILGLLIDVLHGSILAQNGLALILSGAFIMHVKQSFFTSNLSTQQVYVFAAAAIYLGLIVLVHILIQGFDLSWYLLLSPLMSALFWPPVKWLASKI